MARENKSTVDYKDFEYSGKEFKYSGRIWIGKKDSKAKADRTPMNLTLNGVITIKGCKLIQTDSSCFISFPQYKKQSGDYDSYIYTPKEFNDELDDLAKHIERHVIGVAQN